MTRIQTTQFAVYISDTPVTLKQSHGHQTQNEDVDPEQGYNRAKFESDVREKENFSLVYMRTAKREREKGKTSHDLHGVLNDPTEFQSFNLIG